MGGVGASSEVEAVGEVEEVADEVEEADTDLKEVPGAQMAVSARSSRRRAHGLAAARHEQRAEGRLAVLSISAGGGRQTKEQRKI